MMLKAMSTGVLLMTMGCAPVPPSAPAGAAPAPNAECDASRASSLIGRAATAGLGAEALRLTGARGLRWIQPGTAVTMDYRPDRLNIKLDAQNRVTGLDCG